MLHTNRSSQQNGGHTQPHVTLVQTRQRPNKEAAKDRATVRGMVAKHSLRCSARKGTTFQHGDPEKENLMQVNVILWSPHECLLLLLSSLSTWTCLCQFWCVTANKLVEFSEVI